jgi:hypothetical protein
MCYSVARTVDPIAGFTEHNARNRGQNEDNIGNAEVGAARAL